jgi:glycosyltransferase involved in cell wall biosynthesis
MMRVAVAHEWLTNWAGSERVARELVTVGEATQLIASVVDREFVAEYFSDVAVRALWPSHLPTATTHWSRFAAPMLAAWASVKIDADLLLVSSHFAAHGATIRFAGPSIVYYHTPARILWRPDIELARLPPSAQAIVEKAVLPALRAWDARVARHPTVLLGNSSAVVERIAHAYGREAEVLHPPVEVERWSTTTRREPEHFLWAGRLVAYKRPDIAVEAARLSGEQLVIVGSGPERARLEPTAPPNVRFVGHVSDAELRDLMGAAHALVFPGEEDFGIAPVESLASGTPVVAYGAGGALDYIEPHVNGVLCAEQDALAFARAIDEGRKAEWDTIRIRQSAERFAARHHRAGLRRIVERTVGTGRNSGSAALEGRSSGG